MHVDGAPVAKAARAVEAGADIVVRAGERPDYVGRGALKLAGLLDDLQRAPTGHRPPPVVLARRCLDAGASTGGFTEVLLMRGAATVYAVDVGHDQLARSLRADPRVVDLAGTTIRGLHADALAGPVDLLVADLSFISLQLVMPDLAGLVSPGGDLLLLVKPQFEVGRNRLGSSGVVRDPGLRAAAVEAVARAGQSAGLRAHDVRASRWPGPSGNVEYFVWLSAPRGTLEQVALDPAELPAVVRRAVEEGPT